MGISGTKVAQSASDIVILDDKFSSIVNAILWGRCVYDNIRKFLQFQITVNIVALCLVFGGAVSGLGSPITAIQMLWVNLVMGSLAALAYASDRPVKTLLDRKPYKLNATIFSRPMIRNITIQAIFQLIMLYILLFSGPSIFHVNELGTCSLYKSSSGGGYYNVKTMTKINTNVPNPNLPLVNCGSFFSVCPNQNYDCYTATNSLIYGISHNMTTTFQFSSIPNYSKECLSCVMLDFTLDTIIFNTFIYCQLFNMFVCRYLASEIHYFGNLLQNPMFIYVAILIVVLQTILTQVAGYGFQTYPLTTTQWFITVGLAFITLPVGVLMKFIPIEEDPQTFAHSDCYCLVNNRMTNTSVINESESIHKSSNTKANIHVRDSDHKRSDTDEELLSFKNSTTPLYNLRNVDKTSGSL